MNLDQMKTLLDEFKESVDTDIRTIKNLKKEIAAMRSEIYSQLAKVKYVRDENRLVLSAPEIIIGNVDAAGTLLPGGKGVIIRSNEVDINGVGKGGTISLKAPVIQQTAVDTGIDGLENIVWDNSQIVSQARSITLDSQNVCQDDGIMGFFHTTVAAPNGCVNIHAASKVNIDASVPGCKKKDDMEVLIMDNEVATETANDEIGQKNASANSSLKKLNLVLATQHPYFLDEAIFRTQVEDFNKLNEDYQKRVKVVYQDLEDYYLQVSKLAELKRQKKCLESDKDKIIPKDEKDFKTKSTGASVNITSELIDITSKDADGNMRTNKGAGCHITSNNVEIGSRIDSNDKKSSTLLPYSEVRIDSMNVNISTADVTEMELKEDTEVRTVNPKGYVTINSGFVNIESYKKKITDTYKKQDGDTVRKDEQQFLGYPEFKEEGLKGLISLRSNNIDLSAVDKDLQADGYINLNGKEIEITSIDKKFSDDMANKAVKDSRIIIYADNVLNRYYEDFPEISLLEIKSKETALFTTDKFLIQGKDDAVLQMKDGKAELSAKNGVTIYGKATIKNDLDLQSNLKVDGKVDAKSVETKALKTPSVADQSVTQVKADNSLAMAILKESHSKMK